MVNDGAWGLGVINPAQTQYCCGFYGNPGSGGSTDPQTGYMAPIGVRALGPDERYSYVYYLALGNLDTIRSYAYGVMGH